MSRVEDREWERCICLCQGEIPCLKYAVNIPEYVGIVLDIEFVQDVRGVIVESYCSDLYMESIIAVGRQILGM